MDSDEFVTVAKLGAPHGVRGWLRLHSFTEPAERLADYSPLYMQVGQQREPLKIEKLQSRGKGFLLKLAGIDDRDAAALLANRLVDVAVSQLAAPDAGEYYWHELIGMTVQCVGGGELLGTVTDMMQTGANDVMVVKGDGQSIDRRERLLPFVQGQYVLSIDRQQRRIQVDWDPAF